jgi:predicted RNA-binding protein with PIN domain
MSPPASRVSGPAPNAVLVDGYNLLHAIPRFAPRGAELAPARAGLERWLADAAARQGVGEVVLVWDGGHGDETAAARSRPGRSPLKVVFTQAGETADERILALCRGVFASRAADTWVVSSDHGVQVPARELGFGAIGAMTFFRRWSEARPRGACGREAERTAGGGEAKPLPTRRDVDELFEQFLSENAGPLPEDEP